MDNLAHSLISSVVGVAVVPKIAETHKIRLMVASALVANSPDLDIALSFFGNDYYHFNHRGLTHSIFGLLFFIPLGVLIFRKVMGSAFWEQGGAQYGIGYQIKFVAIQLIISHFFLDYLTTYGTMVLYPFSFDRFAFPLMYIFDPWLWMIGFTGVILILLPRFKTEKALRGIAMMTLLSVIILWGVELTYKNKAEALYEQNANVPTPQVIESYPASILAPTGWNLVGKDEREESLYHQGMVSFTEPSDQRFVDLPVPENFRHGKLCNESDYSPAAQEAFQKFLRWGEPIACHPVFKYGGSVCLCVSLKYTAAATWETAPFGLFSIHPDGRAQFTDPSEFHTLLK